MEKWHSSMKITSFKDFTNYLQNKEIPVTLDYMTPNMAYVYDSICLGGVRSIGYDGTTEPVDPDTSTESFKDYLLDIVADLASHISVGTYIRLIKFQSVSFRIETDYYGTSISYKEFALNLGDLYLAFKELGIVA